MTMSKNRLLNTEHVRFHGREMAQSIAKVKHTRRRAVERGTLGGDRGVER